MTDTLTPADIERTASVVGMYSQRLYRDGLRDLDELHELQKKLEALAKACRDDEVTPWIAECAARLFDGEDVHSALSGRSFSRDSAEFVAHLVKLLRREGTVSDALTAQNAALKERVDFLEKDRAQMGTLLVERRDEIAALKADLQKREMFPVLQRKLKAAKDRVRLLDTKLQKIEADMEEAAGELMVPIPEPGTTQAKLLHANVMQRYRIREAEERAGKAEDRVKFLESENAEYERGVEKIKKRLKSFDDYVKGRFGT